MVYSVFTNRYYEINSTFNSLISKFTDVGHQINYDINQTNVCTIKIKNELEKCM